MKKTLPAIYKESNLERQFRFYFARFSKKAPIAEHKFHPVRKFRFDFAWLDEKVAVEIEGGLYGKGRHTTVTGFNGDCEKYNLATLEGWKVLRFTEKMLANNPEQCVKQVITLLNAYE